ncbi:MAG TPA: ABC transporter substrate-binding protein [Candidatus Nanoarchaeia archaeon]
MDELPKQKRSFFRRELVYLAVVLIAATIVGILAVLRLNTTTTTTQGSDYLENLPKDEVTVGVLQQISGLYPKTPFDVDSLAINSNIFEGLTQIRNGRVGPALAEGWTNPDNLTWRIKLRNGVKFHNGEALNASDVKYSIEQAKNNQDWVSNSLASRIDSVSVVDDSTVELKTAKPEPTLLHWLVFLCILSEDQVKKDGLDKAVGTGPYKLVSIDKKQITLEANNAYWGGAPKVKKLVYKAFDDNKALAEGLENGEADTALLFEETYNSSLENKGFRVVQARIDEVSFLGFDTSSKKAKHVDAETNPFANFDVRKAIFLAIDVKKLLKATGVKGEPLTQFGTPALVGYNPNIKRADADIQEAKELLEKAGYSNGFKVTLDLNDSSKKFGEEIKKQLFQINIEVELNPYSDFQGFIERLTTDSSFYVGVYGPDTLDSIDLLNSFFHTPDEEGNGFNNFGLFSNEKIDKLLDQASATFNTNERSKLTQTIQAEVMKQLPVVPLYTRVGNFAIRDDVAFKPAPFGFIFGVEISGRQKATNTQQ